MENNTYKLGRLVNHDYQSWNYRLDTSDIQITDIEHARIIPVLDQGQMGSCHDDKTEILTSSGFIPFSYLTLKDKVATVNPLNNKLIYENPKKIIKFPYKGDMYTIEKGGQNFNVTPDHKMLVRKWDEKNRILSDNYSLIPIKDIGWYSGLMTSIKWDGITKEEKYYTLKGIENYKHKSSRSNLNISYVTWVKFLGIYLAEGTMIKPTTKCPHKIQIAGFKPREKNFIKEILTDLGIHYLELKDRFTFENARIYKELENYGLLGIKASQKFVPAFIFNLSSELITEFLIGHREGDGSLQNGTWTHITSSKQLANDIQRLLFLSGKKTGFSIRKPRNSVMKDGRIIKGNYHSYCVRNLITEESSIDRKKDIKITRYDGIVYCAEVPTYHTLVTRRDGKILISGNCTGNAGIGAINTAPFIGSKFYKPDEIGAIDLYSEAEKIDGGAGYPPEDNGSSGLSIAKALQKVGEISVYQHTFTLNDALKALMQYPIIVGTVWTQDMFTPDADGRVHPTGAVVGGHEWQPFKVDAQNGRIWAYNSWGATWGINGTFYITWLDFATLLAQQGDVTVLIPPITINVVLTRQPDNGVETIGSLIYGSFTCDTLERAWKNNQMNVSCIPKGTYQCVWSYQQDLNEWHYEVKNVSGRSGIFIHQGNYYPNTEGCILLGTGISDLNGDGQLDVANTLQTVAIFEQTMKKLPFNLIIQ